MTTRPRSIAIYGGSFDPIHNGHLAVARAALRRFHLDEVHFVVSGRPPHKLKQQAAPFPHRYAMVALGCAGEPHFVPSLAEAGEDFSGLRTFYSFETVYHFRRAFGRRRGRLYFILGADSFLELPTWRNFESLLSACDFIVASRPGYRLEPLRRVIPPKLLRRSAASDRRSIALRTTTVHLLDSVASSVSSTDVRRRLRRGRSIRGLVPAAVEEYILRQALYQ